MATTGIWKVEKRLDHVLDYVMNPEKTTTDNSCYQELHQVDIYNDLGYNSEFGCYISGLNCLPEQAYKDMMDTKNPARTRLLTYYKKLKTGVMK